MKSISNVVSTSLRIPRCSSRYAGAGHGKMYGKAYSVCPSGIYVAADSGLTDPRDLAGVEVGVGYHSGSHYSALQALEGFLDRQDVVLSFVGRPFDRVRLLLEG